MEYLLKSLLHFIGLLGNKIHNLVQHIFFIVNSFYPPVFSEPWLCIFKKISKTLNTVPKPLSIVLFSLIIFVLQWFHRCTQYIQIILFPHSLLSLILITYHTPTSRFLPLVCFGGPFSSTKGICVWPCEGVGIIYWGHVGSPLNTQVKVITPCPLLVICQ